MTIAAGFYCQDGVVLSAADSLMTASPSKTHESKVSRFDFDGGKIGFALAGSVAGALSAIAKVQKHLKARKPKDAFAEIESTLEGEYTRQVLNDSFDYSLLFALWRGDRVELYGTSGVSVFPINSWEAMDLAKFIVLQGHAPSRIEQALKRSSYMLSSIQESVDGCGGLSFTWSLLMMAGTD